ncbi:MAG: ATP-binding cassette domain-containing protein, partial [candidate division WOR-3 bacterium]
MAGYLIKGINLTKEFDLGKVKVNALQGVDIEIQKGEYLCIMGPSGSGKSTLMHILGCLDTPTSGEYYLEGISVTKMTDPELARIRNEKIGFIFQNFNLLPRLTAAQNVELPLFYAAVKPSDARKRVNQLLEKLG